MNEECDDGNTDDGDCCSSTCEIEPNCWCDGYGFGTCELKCHDGVRDVIPHNAAYPFQFNPDGYSEILSLIHISEPRDLSTSRMPSSA